MRKELTCNEQSIVKFCCRMATITPHSGTTVIKAGYFTRAASRENVCQSRVSRAKEGARKHSAWGRATWHVNTFRRDVETRSRDPLDRLRAKIGKAYFVFIRYIACLFWTSTTLRARSTFFFSPIIIFLFRSYFRVISKSEKLSLPRSRLSTPCRQENERAKLRPSSGGFGESNI